MGSAYRKLFAVLALAALSRWSGAALPERDPQDGPHADVRVRIYDGGVRIHLIVNLAFADEVVNVAREDPEALHPVEVEALRAALVEHFTQSIGVTIDELAAAPTFTEFEVPEVDRGLLGLFPRAGMRALVRLRFTLEYPARVPPRLVTLHWGDYPPNPILATEQGTPALETAALVSAYGVDRLVRFAPEEPEYTWRSTGLSLDDLFRPVPAPRGVPTLSLPLASLAVLVLYALWAARALARGRRRWVVTLLPLAVGVAALTWSVGHVEVRDPFDRTGGLPDEGEAAAILEPLLANVYRAFDYEEEGDVYDALARSVGGDLLAPTYDRIYKSLVYQEAEGALARVRAVTPLETELLVAELRAGSPYLEVETRWQVEGGVYHWGHSHRRVNAYHARYGIAALEGGWRLVSTSVLSEERIDASPEGGFESENASRELDDSPGEGEEY